MFFVYQIIIIILIIFSPLIILIRILKKKEHHLRFKEKFSLNSKLRPKGKLIWFHGASVGEILSIIPLVKNLEKNNEIKTILITSSTLSSSIVYEKYKSRKTIHQFFPIDSFFLTKKFLDYWKPTMAIFIDSEIWPSMFENIKQKKIPLLLLNARITKRSFKRWIKFKKISNYIFSKIDIAYPQNRETLNYLKKLKVLKIKIIGNLKFSENEKEGLIQINKSFTDQIKNRKIWCASSTHSNEEEICGQIHLNLKKKYPDLLTIIIPRHTHRSEEVKNDLEKLGLSVVLRSSKIPIKKRTDIYLVDTYGETKKFYKICNTVFLGGSVTKHGGQNPLEAARLGSTIIHGPNIDNFKEVYELLGDTNITLKANNIKKLNKLVYYSLRKDRKNTKFLKIKKIGKKILTTTTKEINSILRDEIKKA